MIAKNYTDYSYVYNLPVVNNTNFVIDSSDKSEKLFDNCDEWLTHEEASAYLRVSAGALRNMVWRNMVDFYKLGRRNRYKKNDLRKLLSFKEKGESL